VDQGTKVRRPLAIAVGLALLATLGITPPATAAAGTAQIGGQLTDFAGAPITSKVEVQVQQLITNVWGYFENVTVATLDVDGDGRWVLPDLAGGTYSVTARGKSCDICYSPRGWSPDPYHIGPGEHFDVADGESRLDLDIQLYFGASISANVLALPDDPTNVMRIATIEYLRPDTGKWQWVRTAHLTTGSYMSIVANQLPPGTYRVTGSSGHGAAAWTTPRVTVGDLGAHNYTHQLVRTDILARSTSGSLLRYELNGSSLSPYTRVASGWGNYNRIIDVGDVNEDGYPDILARDSAYVLWLRPGTASRTYGPAVRVSSGWSGYARFTAAGDMDSDGHADFIAQTSSGALYLVRGRGNGTFHPRKLIGSSSTWSAYIRLAGGVDFDGDGSTDDLVVKSSSGRAYVFLGNGSGGFERRVLLSTGWASVHAIAAVGQFDNDEYADVAAITTSGSLVVWRGGANVTLQGYVKYATGWQNRLII
jgi:hypothetical protein